MDTQVVTGRWNRDELQRAHDNFVDTANRCAESGEWGDWTNLFTEDAHYVEHMFGEMHGRAEIPAWISATMAEWPNKAMTSFPHAWCVCDEEKG